MCYFGGLKFKSYKVFIKVYFLLHLSSGRRFFMDEVRIALSFFIISRLIQWWLQSINRVTDSVPLLHIHLSPNMKRYQLFNKEKTIFLAITCTDMHDTSFFTPSYMRKPLAIVSSNFIMLYILSSIFKAENVVILYFRVLMS